MGKEQHRRKSWGSLVIREVLGWFRVFCFIIVYPKRSTGLIVKHSRGGYLSCETEVELHLLRYYL